MVVFLDFENEDDDPYSRTIPHHSHGCLQDVHGLSQSISTKCKEIGPSDKEQAGSNGSLFASALACYPVSLSIAALLDLNDLCALSFSCRAIHQSLFHFARQLRTQSLHCTNDVPPPTSEEMVDNIIFKEAMDRMGDLQIAGPEVSAYLLPAVANASQLHVSSHSALGLSGKVSKCARDMVAPCRKCGVIVCRNCAVKPPSNRCLPNRHRRLCRTCLDAPLIDHLHSLNEDHDINDSPPTSSASSARSVRSLFSSSSQETDQADRKPAFTSQSFMREPCSCDSRGVYLCQPCGQSLVAGDTTYKRVWTWRSRYSTHIGGGLGTGLGLGNQGQKCGRGQYCLERGIAGVCWVEIECSEARAQNYTRDDGFGISRSSTPLFGEHESEGTIINRPGYLSQELEGIGGVLKKKVKKKIKVGATVYEFDDERETGKYLQRESSGRQRSWCGWCSRVCPGATDKIELGQLLDRHD